MLRDGDGRRFERDVVVAGRRHLEVERHAVERGAVAVGLERVPRLVFPEAGPDQDEREFLDARQPREDLTEAADAEELGDRRAEAVDDEVRGDVGRRLAERADDQERQREPA